MICRARCGVLSSLFVLGVLAAGQSNAAVSPSGTAVAVDPAVNASGASGQRVLELQGAVFMGDEIVANSAGLAQIKFLDDTKLVIGPNSRLKIDSFVFNPDNTAKKVTISALRGAFRFISGNSPHQAYSIQTPTMVIGVRGTVVDINVGATESSVVFARGAGDVCDRAGHCVSIDRTCQIWVARAGEIGQSTGFDSQRRLAVSFPFLGSQSELAPEFRVASFGCGVADPRVFGTPSETGAGKGTPSTGRPSRGNDE